MWGIDGFCHWVIDANPDKFPTLQKLKNGGNYALAPVGNPVTWECWTTVLTGQLPYHHGIRTMTCPEVGLLSRNEANYQQTFWSCFENVGWRVGVTNFPPMTYPVQQGVRNGWMLSGSLNYPLEVWSTSSDDLQCKLKSYTHDDYWQLGVMLDSSNASIEEIHNRQQQTIDELKIHRQIAFDNVVMLCKEDPVDVLLHYQHFLDFLQHYVLGNRYEDVLEAYEWIDDCLAYIIDTFNPETIIITSDHGQMALREWNNAASCRTQWPQNKVHGDGEIFFTEERLPKYNYICGTHNHIATVLFYGDGISPIDSNILDMALEDIMPTALQAKLITPPTNIDGRIRDDMLGIDSRFAQSQVVEDRLADLGYVDAPPGIGQRDSGRGVIS